MLTHEYSDSRLDKVLKYHSDIVNAGIDPQTFFPAPPPLPTPSALPLPNVAEKPNVKEAPAAESSKDARSSRASREIRVSKDDKDNRAKKIELVRAKSKSAFSMKSLVKS
jgi:hypothetical protein